MSELDRWLARTPAEEGPKAEDEAWQKMAVSDPRAWHKRGNPITVRVAESLAADAELPMQEPTIAKDCRRVAADLLGEAGGNEELILRAQERLRRGSGWKGLGLYVQKRALIHELHKIKAARREFSQLLEDDPIVELAPLDEALLRRWEQLRAEIVGKTERGFYNTWLPPDEPETLRDEGETLIVGVPNEGAAKQCNVEVAELGMSGRVQFVARAGIEAFREADGG